MSLIIEGKSSISLEAFIIDHRSIAQRYTDPSKRLIALNNFLAYTKTWQQYSYIYEVFSTHMLSTLSILSIRQIYLVQKS
jgi:hypothetical protein